MKRPCGSFSRSARSTDRPPMPESKTRMGRPSARGIAAAMLLRDTLEGADHAVQDVDLVLGEAGALQDRAKILNHRGLHILGAKIAGRLECGFQMLHQAEQMRLRRRSVV